FEFIKNKDLSKIDIGKHDVNDKGVFAIVSEYKTKEISETFIECHRKYIDIQIILNGNEKIGICNKQDCTSAPYNEEQDYQKLEGELSFISLKAGLFAIFFPDDGHMPQVKHKNIPENVKKVVFKVPVLNLCDGETDDK
ncbi:MAG: YhcH/YjgK/YiaL family protein, partial [Desulfobacterales bacterium]|nr:YhcH/YjgK/YiaL family protein [Desulfobacterales bacterium]